MNLGAFTAPPIFHAQKSRTRPVAKPESKAVVAVPVQPRQIFRPVEDLPLIEERDHLDKRVNSVAVLKGASGGLKCGLPPGSAEIHAVRYSAPQLTRPFT